MSKSILNFPNALTVLRVILVPFFIYFLLKDDFFFRMVALGIFITASLTDLIDGYLARKWKQETEFGKFLDPLADKILVLGAFLTFILLDEQIEIWMVLLIIARDMLITTLRWLAIKSGSSLRTTMMGKVKTTFQMAAIILILVFFMVVSSHKKVEINALYETGRNLGKSGFTVAVENYLVFTKSPQQFTMNDFSWVDSIASFVPYFVMLVTTLVTVLSGIRYIITNFQLFTIENLMKLARRKS